jgi:hypothetical protein
MGCPSFVLNQQLYSHFLSTARTRISMDFNSLIVSIEIDGGSFRGLQESGMIAIVTAFHDNDVSSTASAPKQNQFRLQRISHGPISPYEDGAVFSLQSVSSDAYLAVNGSDRTAMLSHEQFPPPDAFRFKFKQEHGPFSVEIPCSIEPLDQGPIKDAVDPSITLMLCIRAMQWAKEKPTVIEDQYIQQIGIIAALQQANEVTYGDSHGIHADHDALSNVLPPRSTIAARAEAETDSKEKSYLDIKDIMAHVQEIIDNGDLMVAKKALGGSYRSGQNHLGC